MRTRIAIVMIAVAVVTWAQTPAKLKEFVIEPVEPVGSHHNSLSNTEVNADRVVLRDLIGFVYRTSPVRVQGPGWLDDTYSVKARPQSGEENQFLSALQRALLDRLHLRVEHTGKEMPVYVVRMANPDAPKINQGSGAPTMSGGNGSLSVVNVPMSEFDDFLTGTFGRPVVDETGLKGRYTFDLAWPSGDLEALSKVISDRLGLVLTEDRRKVDVLLVERLGQ
jgi:uncharacterized protein (TIGR03435 family)